jgi:hypothetical protein
MLALGTRCLFVAPISKWWRDLYAAVDSQQLIVSYGRIVITCIPQMTLYSSVFTSPSRVQLAHERGLNCTSAAHRCAAGKCADAATLAAAHMLGMEYTTEVMFGATDCNKLAEVQYLHSQGCPWHHRQLELAAVDGHFKLMRWCHEHGCPFKFEQVAKHFIAESGDIELMAWALERTNPILMVDVMDAAASKGHTAMCKSCTLRSAHGAQKRRAKLLCMVTLNYSVG